MKNSPRTPKVRRKVELTEKQLSRLNGDGDSHFDGNSLNKTESLQQIKLLKIEVRLPFFFFFFFESMCLQLTLLAHLAVLYNFIICYSWQN